MFPIIGIAGNHRFNELDTENLILTYTPDGFVKGLQKSNSIPVVIPVSEPELAHHYISRVDGLLLAGGQDVSPLLFGEEPNLKLGRTYPLRDVFELALIEEAYKQKKPILAICRGLQILNIAFGGTLFQDIESQYEKNTVLHPLKTMPSYPTHSIQIANGSELSKILGTQASVNSYHHQAVRTLSPKFTPVAWSSDGIIEAFESHEDGQSMLAVQWHPETMINQSEKMQGIFSNFIDRVCHSLEKK